MNRKDSSEALRDFALSAAPGHLLRRNHQRSVDIFNRHVGGDVTRQQIATLLALDRHPGASQRDLVEATGIDKSTLKEMINRMVARDWIKRKRAPSDSRAWTMSLTETGAALLLDRIERIEAAQREILEPLAEKDRADFMRCLRLLIGIDPGAEDNSSDC